MRELASHYEIVALSSNYDLYADMSAGGVGPARLQSRCGYVASCGKLEEMRIGAKLAQLGL